MAGLHTDGEGTFPADRHDSWSVTFDRLKTLLHCQELIGVDCRIGKKCPAVSRPL